MLEAKLPAGLLHIPDQKNGSISSFDPRPRAVEAWVKALPRADVGETARQVYKGLYELNRVAIPDADRFRISELFREPVNYLSMSLKKHYIGLPLPLPRKKHKVVLLARELYAELALSYKIVIENKLANGVSRLDSKMMTAAIHRAIRNLGLTLQRCYQTYIPAPVNIWRELHGLYLYAHATNQHNIVVKDDLGENSANTSIMELYKQIVLLGLAGPYRLRQSEVETLAQLLIEWSPLTQISEIVDPELQTGMCSLNLNSDEPPGYLTLCSDSNISYCRVLDTSQLIARVSEFIRNGVAVQAPGALGKANRLGVDVLHRLALSWGGMAKRNFVRTTKGEKIRVTIGLPAIHHFIHGPEVQAPEQRTETTARPEKAPEKPPMTLDLVPLDGSKPNTATSQHFHQRSGAYRLVNQPVIKAAQKDQWNGLYNMDTPDYAKARDPLGGPATHSQARHEFHTCTARNESAGGFCLVWLAADGMDLPNLNVLVGELIGMQDDDEENPGRWSIGVIRWMKSPDPEQLELGVQKIAPYAIAAAIARDRTHAAPERIRSLVLPERINAGQPVTLVVPNTYDVGDTVALEIDGERRNVRLVKLLESTGSYAHYRFKEMRRNDRSNDPDEDGVERFDKLWKSL